MATIKRHNTENVIKIGALLNGALQREKFGISDLTNCNSAFLICSKFNQHSGSRIHG